MKKKLYKGQFNYSGELFELFTHSTSPECALLNFANQIGKKLQVGKRTVLIKFNGSINNYYIKEVKK